MAALLLKKYKERFDGGAVHASWVYLRQWAVGAMPANPLTSYDTSARHLRDPTFLKRALRCPGKLFHELPHVQSEHTACRWCMRSGASFHTKPEGH